VLFPGAEGEEGGAVEAVGVVHGREIQTEPGCGCDRLMVGSRAVRMAAVERCGRWAIVRRGLASAGLRAFQLGGGG
jgi:hypothetical protein